MLKLDLGKKVEESEVKFPHPLDYQKSKRVPEKCQLLLTKDFDYVDHNKL